MNQSQTVILVDAHADVRPAYRLLLSMTKTLTVVGEAMTTTEACHCYAQQRPNVVIMDVNLPDISGPDAIRKLLAQDPQARILVTSLQDNSVHVASLLAAGALGFVCKSSAPETLIEAVHCISQGQRFVDPAVITAPRVDR
jgi:two-component system invasion response regulator UvrY